MKARLFLTATAAVLALVAPTAALAGGSPDDRALPRATTFSQGGIAPDDRALPRSTTITLTPRRTIVSPDDRSFARSIPVGGPTVLQVSNGGFDWTDAGLGAASGFGIALVLVGTGLTLMRRGAHRPAAA